MDYDLKRGCPNCLKNHGFKGLLGYDGILTYNNISYWGIVIISCLNCHYRYTEERKVALKLGYTIRERRSIDGVFRSKSSLKGCVLQ